MAPGMPRARFNSSGLVRLLHDMAPAEVADAGQTLGEQLGLWLGWIDAITLAGVLGGTAEASGQARVPTPKALAQDLARVSGQVALAFAQDKQLQPPAADPAAADSAHTVPDFAPYRRSHQAHQAAMDNAVPALRGRVRAALAARPGAGAQLAALDEVMEQALAERERQTLASVPRWLEQRYRHLHATQASHAPAERRFRQDLQDVLRAELELRLQPVQGLIDALGEAPAPEQKLSS
jgi:hypothetical protein